MVHSLPILVGDLELAEEADELVAIKALFWLNWDFAAHHTRGLFNEIFLELVHWHVGVTWE